MKKDYSLTQKKFDALLGWFSADRNEAGAAYEQMRDGLIRFFRFRGCSDPPALADETINRVASKMETFDRTQNVKTITYFYSFAFRVFLEYSRTAKQREVSLDSEKITPPRNFQTPDTPDAFDCLENCLKKLPEAERTLVTQYYGEGKKMEKSEARREQAAAKNLTMPALHVKVSRIRVVLRECVEKCLGKNIL